MDKNESKNIDEYISGFSEDMQSRMKELRKVIHEVAPHAEESIRYKMASFKIGESSFVYFAGFKNHISFYPFPTGVKELEKESSAYNTSGRGTIQFQNDEEIPYDLVRKLVRYWLKESTGNTLYND